jgi:formate hydrogenlyase subunit 3/multisubunit Na+/H+ antiporter MnhD subunit
MNTTLSGGLLLLGVIWPLLLTLMLVFRRINPAALHLAPWAALPALVVSLLLTPSDIRWQLPGVLMGSELGLDTTGQMFLLLSAFLWTAAGVYARAYFPQPDQRTRFYFFFLLAMAGNFGLIVAHDLPGFYLGFTLMSFASYGLVIFNGTAAALRAGRVYIGLVVVGELMLFVALLLAVQATGATSFDAVRVGLIDADNRDLVILLTLAGFGIKTGIFGLHVWLPLAHPVAPTPASAVLSGAMIKAGLLGWLRLLPLGEIALPSWGITVIILGLAAAFYGVVIGLTQRDPKTLLAYSSISQMGIMTMAMGLGMLAPEAWPVILPGIAFYALHHALSKGALFLGAGLAGSHHRLQRRWVWFGLWLPALALAGAPWSSGMLAKGLIKTYALYAPVPWDGLLPVLLSASAVATALLMARLLYLLRPAGQPVGLVPMAGLVWPWVAVLMAVLLAPWWLGPTLSKQLGSMQAIESLWPVLLAFFVTVVVLWAGLFQSVRPLPAGDILVLWERSLQPLYRMVRSWGRIQYTFSATQRWCQDRMVNLVAFAIAIMKRTEDYFARWDVAVFLVVIMLLATSLIASIR